MSKVKIVSFSTTKEDKGFVNFYPHLVRLYRSAKKFGYNDFSFWNREKIKKTDFYKENKEILDQKRGAGYWLWKPYIILEELKKIKDEDFLVYADSANYFINDIKPLLELTKKNNGFYFEEQRFEDRKLKHWTKRDCFYYMDADNKEFYNTYIRQASFIILQKNKVTINFIKEWLIFATNKHIISDIDNTCGLDNLIQFKDHRHDQSIFSILAHKHKILGFRPPTQWGNNFKLEKYKKPDEFINANYNIDYSLYLESDYDTLLYHNKEIRLIHKLYALIINVDKLIK
jgi:hypothetical protein